MRRNKLSAVFSWFARVGAQSCCALRTAFEPGRSQTAPLRKLMFLALFLPLAALAQSVRWDPPSGQLGFNQVSELALVFENCEPDLDNFRLSQVDGLSIGRPAVTQGSSGQIIIGGPGSSSSFTKTFTMTFPVRPNKRSNITIPAFAVLTDKGKISVPAATYTVGDATSGNSSAASDDIASAKLSTARDTFWAGEIIPITFALSVVQRYVAGVDNRVDWQPAPIVIEDWSKPEPIETLLRGDRYWVVTQSTRGYVKQPGKFTISLATQLVNLKVGTSGFGFFSAPTVEQRQIRSKPLELTIRPLPPAPANFSDAVGEFTFTSKVIPTTAGVGEPVTWTIELSGTGNWPDISGLPQRDVSNDFQVVQPKSKRTMKEASLFEGTLSEDVVLVPTKPGTYRLAPVHFTYFDTKTGTYKTVASEPATVTVTATSQTAPAPTGAPVQFSLNAPPTAATDSPALPAAVPPVPPENLPRDPLTEPAQGFVPLPLRQLVVGCLLSVVLCVLLVWLVLAALRSRQNDPQRLRREARARLSAALNELGGSSLPATRYSLLRNWQQQTAALWEVPHAAPGTPMVHAHVGARSKDAAADWARLWSEADRALHSREQTLPPDWPSRAESALQAVHVPGWPLFSLFARRNLLPFLGRTEELKAEGLHQVIRIAAWLVLLFSLSAIQPSALGAEPAIEAYKRGDFETAEQSWRTALSAAPNDWTARHNLGLALAQQDRWAEAAAHWTSAFLLKARADTTRWDLALGLQRSGMAPAELVELSRGEGRFKLARLATPGEWQLMLLLAALLLVIALVLLLLQGYRRIGAWGKPVALAASLLAVLLAAAATLSLHAYGPLAHPEAALVWRASTLHSIPTEVDTSQKSSPLSAGSIALVEKTFLGWTKLQFATGQTGWARTEDLIKLYR